MNETAHTPFPTLRRCTSCGTLRFYPKPLCARCHQPGGEPGHVRGTGTIYSVTTVHRAPSPAFKADIPYVIVLVDLDEGVRVTGRLARDGDAGEPRCGARVALRGGPPQPFAIFELQKPEPGL